jgi:phosphoesterase RecJ-like protein
LKTSSRSWLILPILPILFNAPGEDAVVGLAHPWWSNEIPRLKGSSAMTDAYDQAAALVVAAPLITITTHINPDGDGIGAGLALALALEAQGRRVRFLCPSPVASLYSFLPRFEIIRPVASAAAEEPAGLVVSCDAGDKERLGAVWQVPRTQLINLDHHATNTRFGDCNLVDEQAESSGVVAARLLDRLGWPLTPAMAECLYTTIVFDTGRFMHGNTTAHTFRFAARLLDCGIDAAAINRRLTYTRTPQDLALQRLALEHLAVDQAEPRLAGIALDLAAIGQVGEPEDWGELVELPRSLLGNQVAYLVRERREKSGAMVCKASLRANPPVAVGPVAQAYGGGGHLQAAGCTIPGTLAEVMPGLLERLRVAVGAGGRPLGNPS